MLLVSLAFAADLPPEVARYEWITGEWHGQTEERWVAAGSALWSVALAPSGFEVCRITLVDGRVTYLASPGGNAPVAFDERSSGTAFAEFTNPAHDFPQVIRYDRSGDKLVARVGLLDAEPAFSLRWRRVEPRLEGALVALDGGTVVASGRRGAWGYTIGEGEAGPYATVWHRVHGVWERVTTVR